MLHEGRCRRHRRSRVVCYSGASSYSAPELSSLAFMPPSKLALPCLEVPDAEKMRDFQDDIIGAATTTISRLMPLQMLNLKQLVDDVDKDKLVEIAHRQAMLHTALPFDDLDRSPPLPLSKKRKREVGTDEPRRTSTTFQERVQRMQVLLNLELDQLASHCDKLKLWLCLSLNGSNNLLVALFSDCLSEVQRTQDCIAAMRKSNLCYQLDRLNLFSLASASSQTYHNTDSLILNTSLNSLCSFAVALDTHDEVYLARQHQFLLDLLSFYIALSDLCQQALHGSSNSPRRHSRSC
ncbi:hypothetical protein BKA62DRAFT_226298 [Auriculariales sp. MPI-PUGE-AT-0066]|nr:hypothetical protein BKA62DRAFT_226298 [Auriculariales sp. MPI-PUGE-AT-0066]